MERDEMTTGEAAAWRAGWEAAREAAARIADAGSRLNNDEQWQQGEDRRAEDIAAAIRAMGPPR